MFAEHYRALARYNAWMNERLFSVCDSISDADRKRDLGAFFRSIHGTFNHLLLTDRAWLGRIFGDPARFASRNAAGEIIPFQGLDQELYADWDALRRERADTDRAILAWTSSVDEAALSRTLAYADSRSRSYQHPMWWAASHMFNHQAHHRGQITTLIHQLGIDPGVTDLAVFLRSGPTQP